MTTRKPPIPCYLCGGIVRKLGAVRWNGSGDPEDGYITGIFPVCLPCTAKPEVQSKQPARFKYAIHGFPPRFSPN